MKPQTTLWVPSISPPACLALRRHLGGRAPGNDSNKPRSADPAHCKQFDFPDFQRRAPIRLLFVFTRYLSGSWYRHDMYSNKLQSKTRTPPCTKAGGRGGRSLLSFTVHSIVEIGRGIPEKGTTHDNRQRHLPSLRSRRARGTRDATRALAALATTAYKVSLFRRPCRRPGLSFRFRFY